MPLHRQPLQNVLLIVSAHLGRNRQRPLLDPAQMLVYLILLCCAWHRVEAQTHVPLKFVVRWIEVSGIRSCRTLVHPAFWRLLFGLVLVSDGLR